MSGLCNRRLSSGPQHLRVIAGGLQGARAEPEEHGAASRQPHHRSALERCVIVAGSEPQRRAAVVAELASILPEDVAIEEAELTWQVLQHAPCCRLVMLTGELEDSPAERVISLIGRRHPGLPIVSLQQGA